MKEYIRPFLNQKNISENSKIAYSYDLEQFIEEVHGRITEGHLAGHEAGSDGRVHGHGKSAHAD